MSTVWGQSVNMLTIIIVHYRVGPIKLIVLTLFKLQIITLSLNFTQLMVSSTSQQIDVD